MILKIEYLVKWGKKTYLSGWPEHLYLGEKYEANRYSSKDDAIDAIMLFGKQQTIRYQYTFTIKEEITIENNNSNKT